MEDPRPGGVPAGNWDAALKAIEKDYALRGGKSYVYPNLIRALAHARKGEMEEAREWFAKVQKTEEAKGLADTPRELYEEAVALLGEDTPSTDPNEGRPEAGADPK